MARRFQANQQKTRILVLGTGAAIFGLAVWSALTPSPREWSSAYAATSNAHAPKNSTVATITTTANSAGAPGPAPRCNPWDVSPEAMEAMLQEMVRRGWRPPRSDLALASMQPEHRLPIKALNPDQPVWVSGRRGTMPAETGEIVDVTIEPQDDAQSGNASAPANSPATTTPAPTEPIQTPARDAADVPPESDASPAPSTP